MTNRNDTAKHHQQQSKVCSKCGRRKDRSEFSRAANCADGVRPDCKVCESSRGRLSRAANPEQLKAAKRAHYLVNKHSILAKQKEYREENAEKIAATDSARKKADRTKNPEKFRDANRRWSQANPEKVKAKTERWMLLNADRKRETNRQWKIDNAEKVKAQAKDWWTNNKATACAYTKKRRSTPQGRIEASVRSGIYRQIADTSRKPGKTFEIIGYTPQELMQHLSRQFLSGMSWENYGEWHIDHIVPLSRFHYSSYEDIEFKRAWALANLRPLWAKDNLSKGARTVALL